MSGDPGQTSNFSIAQSSQTQFMQYAIALTFAILGLSVQTNHVGANVVADCFELAAWILLLISGMLGLYRWSKHPAIYNLFGNKQNIDAKVASLEQAKARGFTEIPGQKEKVSIAEWLPKWRELATDFEKEATKGVEEAELQYKWQRGLFSLGIVSLVAARAYVPALHIFQTVFYHVTYVIKP